MLFSGFLLFYFLFAGLRYAHHKGKGKLLYYYFLSCSFS